MKIILYDEGAAEELDVAEIARYLKQKLGKVKIETRGSPFGSDLAPDSTLDFARKIAGAKVQEVNQRIPSEPEPLHAEVEYEKRKILRETRAYGIIYEGFRLRRIFGEVIAGYETVQKIENQPASPQNNRPFQEQKIIRAYIKN